MILVSAGFDAAPGHAPTLGGYNVSPACFGSLTSSLLNQVSKPIDEEWDCTACGQQSIPWSVNECGGCAGKGTGLGCPITHLGLMRHHSRQLRCSRALPGLNGPRVESA